MNHTFIVNQNKSENSVTLLLYGAIGDKIDGDIFAQTITDLGQQYDEIVIRINSEGGNVLQGLSIFNAIANSPAFTVAQIDGVAASMAGVIPMAADVIRMNDFARIMIHSPFIAGRSNLTPKEKKALDNLQAMLVALLGKRGMPAEKITAFMEQETWLTADDALAANLIDEIVQTGKAKEVTSDLALVAASAVTPKHFTSYINIPKENDMKIIASFIGLSESATELEIVAKIKELQASIEEHKASALEMKTLADQLKAEKEAKQVKQVEAMTDQAIAAGFFAKEQREGIIKAGTASFETFQSMITGLQKPAIGASLSAAISTLNLASATESKQDFEWFRRNDAQELAEMKIREPERFNKLYAAWEKENG